MKRIKDFFLRIFYGLPFGLKGADSEIMGKGESSDLGTTINQEVSDESVGRHLLKGEVTQEVEELRYRTYKVANESEDYTYIGNGVAIKGDNEKAKAKTRYKFTQENENVCETVLDALKQVGNYGVEKYRFEFSYDPFVRFRVDKFATKVDVDIDEKTDKIETTLHFNAETNKYETTSRQFVNELSKLLTATTEYEISRNEIAQSIKTLSFTTYKASNEDDFVTYSFLNGGKYKSFKKEGYEFLLTLSWDEYMRVPLDLETKYYSKTMAEKYEKKAAKNNPISMVQSERKRYCSVCGKEMSVYDADIQMADSQEPICKECMMKAINKDKK